MRVKVYLYATLRDRAGGLRRLELDLPDEASVRDLIARLEEAAPGITGELVDDGRVREGYKVMVNGRDVDFLEGLDTRLGDGDEVHIFPPVAGG